MNFLVRSLQFTVSMICPSSHPECYSEYALHFSIFTGVESKLFNLAESQWDAGPCSSRLCPLLRPAPVSHCCSPLLQPYPAAEKPVLSRSTCWLLFFFVCEAHTPLTLSASVHYVKHVAFHPCKLLCIIPISLTGKYCTRHTNYYFLKKLVIHVYLLHTLRAMNLNSQFSQHPFILNWWWYS